MFRIDSVRRMDCPPYSSSEDSSSSSAAVGGGEVAEGSVMEEGEVTQCGCGCGCGCEGGGMTEESEVVRPRGNHWDLSIVVPSSFEKSPSGQSCGVLFVRRK